MADLDALCEHYFYFLATEDLVLPENAYCLKAWASTNTMDNLLYAEGGGGGTPVALQRLPLTIDAGPDLGGRTIRVECGVGGAIMLAVYKRPVDD